MSTAHIYELLCDAPGCTAIYNVAETTATATRQHAARVGWTYRWVAHVGSIDHCPVHAEVAHDGSTPRGSRDTDIVRLAKHLHGCDDEGLALGLAPSTIRQLCDAVIQGAAITTPSLDERDVAARIAAEIEKRSAELGRLLAAWRAQVESDVDDGFAPSAADQALLDFLRAADA